MPEEKTTQNNDATKATSATFGGADIQDLMLQIAKVGNGLQALSEDTGTELTLTQWALLDQVCYTAFERPVELGRALNLPRKHVVKLARSLEGMGLVALHRPDPETHVITIVITEAGIMALKNIEDTCFETIASDLHEKASAFRLGGLKSACMKLSLTIRQRVLGNVQPEGQSTRND